ncbi:MAG: ABC transporter permease subunit [Bacteroidales bacterium]|jgi:ABC-2 type transport system permease protein|nr:ABC transporter permease subunit [Bacteroidales bacterium]
MTQIWIITQRELKAYFDSLMAYILLILFLGFSGFFTWIYGSDIFYIKQATLMPFFSIAYWTLFFFIPALTMRLLSEENRMGTLELLLTKPLSNWQIVFGKFLAALLLIIIALLMTFPYVITISSIGNMDAGQVISGYIALIFFSAMYISIGLFTSSFTNNQIVSYLSALFIGIFFQIIFGMLAQNSSGFIGKTLDYLSVSTHFESMTRGVLDTRDLVYFIGISFISLVLTETMLIKKRYA